MKLPNRIFISLLFIMLCIYGTAQNSTLPSIEEKTFQQDTAIFRFSPGERMFWYDYQGNAESIRQMTTLIRGNKSSIEAGNVKVRVLGFCSSYNTVSENLKAAKDRSNQVKSYFIVHEGLKEAHFRTTNSTRRWRGLKDVIAVAYLWKPTARPVVTTPMSSEVIFSAEEQDRLVTEASKAELPTESPTPTLSPADGTTSSGSSSVEQSPVQTPVEVAPVKETDPSYRWALKTNVAYLAATVANLGVEVRVGSHYSIDLPVLYSPYTVARDYRLRLLVVQPEFRYWLHSPLQGHFFGVHLHVGAFNLSMDAQNRYQSPDGFYGVGLSYGYMLPIARHWAAEFTIGAGYVHTKYDVYYNISNGAKYEKGLSYNYWGLTRVGIGLVYRFGK